MNKLFLLLSMVLVLTACSLPVEQDENTLSPGIMEPVSGTGAVEGGSWLPEIKQH
ncbi:lipoprotein [Pasteurella multocida]|uniref:lipoprotein n=1 Tax=Pasteurella multocida TaxID=747 RepID=UPI00244C0B80|nr:lipoprotein [Pasteurella multocida]